MIDPKILAQVRAAINGPMISKHAFTPLTPEAQAAAQAQMQQGGAGGPPPPGAGMPPPQDPSQMGGAPPQGGVPAQGGPPPPGAAPVMDPALVGGAPPAMDPSQMGGMSGGPPPDPTQGMPPDPTQGGGGQPPPTPVQVTLEDLQAMFGQKDDAASKVNQDMQDSISALGEQIQGLAQALGVSLPSAQTGAGAAPGVPTPAEPAALDAMTQGMQGAPPPQGGAKTASQHSNKLLDTIQRLKRYGG